MPTPIDWLREAVRGYTFGPTAVFRPVAPGVDWQPVHAETPEELEAALAAGWHLLPLPRESAALANVIEDDLRTFLFARLDTLREEGEDVSYASAGERGYPDMELEGGFFGGGVHAADIKVAQRGAVPKKPTTQRRTQSRITLYTGNTYFKEPTLRWPGTLRPFADYAGHVDVVVLYDMVAGPHRVENVEIVVHEPWRIASRERSSTTREYIGAVQELDRLVEGRGDFDSAAAFYKYWRAFGFKASPGLQKVQAAELKRLRALHAGHETQQQPGIG